MLALPDAPLQATTQPCWSCRGGDEVVMRLECGSDPSSAPTRSADRTVDEKWFTKSDLN